MLEYEDNCTPALDYGNDLLVIYAYVRSFRLEKWIMMNILARSFEYLA